MIKGKKILWLDNDPKYTEPYVKKLQNEGCEVTIASTVSQAVEFLNSTVYSLFILDAMIPPHNEIEAEIYPANETERGFKMGVFLFTKWKTELAQTNTKVLALTVRVDPRIREAFFEAGLPKNAFTTKMSVMHVGSFLQKVEELLSD
jgi:CheY-like chemotaxis protein